MSDYVNVAHAFYEGGEPGLVNAVLDSINKAVRE
jgi:transcription termination factor NusB